MKTFEVYYKKNTDFTSDGIGYWAFFSTHSHVATLELEDTANHNDIFEMLNCNQDALDFLGTFIRNNVPDVRHTSMSVGDIVYCHGTETYYVCESIGWRKLTP